MQQESSMRTLKIATSTLFSLATITLLSLLAFSALADRTPFELPLLWPEEQRKFLQDGPGLLLSDSQLSELISGDAVSRQQFIDAFRRRDPLPETPENELLVGIERRYALASRERLTFLDERTRLLFLQGVPDERRTVDCSQTFKPLEIWTYGEVNLLLYRPKPDEPYLLWLPIDSKRALYNPEMEYWLEQWNELRSRLRGQRFDRTICEDSQLVDDITGIDALFGFKPNRPKNATIKAFLDPPTDLAAWARQAAQTPFDSTAAEDPIHADDFLVDFPQRDGQRMRTRMMVVLPAEVGFEPVVVGESKEVRITIDGHLERDGKIFDSFRIRFQMPPLVDEQPMALIVERMLRPGEEFLVRLKVIEESTDRQALLSQGFIVPSTPTGDGLPHSVEEALLVLGEKLQEQRVEGEDSLVLFPPESDVIFGLWRAEALVTGSRISKVSFFLDDNLEMSRRRPPFTAELRLETYPVEQVVKVEGYDDAGELVAADEVVLNQPRGELQVRILEPGRGAKLSATTLAKVEVVVPEEKRISTVSFSVDEQLIATLDKAPWEAPIPIPQDTELSYLTVTAELNDGSRAEDVRFLNAPADLERVDVNLVELYTTVTDGSGRSILGLGAEEFSVFEDGRQQEIVKFELVEDLPLTLGITIDTSGSMLRSIDEAKRAAIGFLENMITPKDRCFAVQFDEKPILLMPRTSDVGAIAKRVEDLVAYGSTSLHDAIVTSLYYYRGVRGRRALVILSDGEDTSSTIEFQPALEYAKRSGVSIYTIALGIGKAQIGIRRKLEALSQATGGRTFYIKRADDLETIYGEIEKELRSQYLVAYSSDRAGDGEYREVKMEMKQKKLKARTIRGYYS
jgi:VWFA-related protein